MKCIMLLEKILSSLITPSSVLSEWRDVACPERCLTNYTNLNPFIKYIQLKCVINLDDVKKEKYAECRTCNI